MFCCFFVILCHRGWKIKSFLFPDNDFGTLAFLFGQSCFCVTFNSWSTPSFGMLLSKLSNSNTHVCTSSIRIFLVLCPHGQGEGGWSSKCGQTWAEQGGVPKIPRFVWKSFMNDPMSRILWLVTMTFSIK